jgi:FtsP/CotA-like multicopper oxidase with cupredoxin domain
MKLIKRGAASAFLPLLLSASISDVLAVPVPGGTLDPLLIPKYVTPLVIPPALYDDQGGATPIVGDVALEEFSQQVLPSAGCILANTAQVAAGGPAINCVGDAFPATTLWGYGDPARPGTVANGGSFNNPALTLEVTQNTPTTVTWINGLVNADLTFKSHIIKDPNGNPLIDQTLHWAAPNGSLTCLGGVVSDCAGRTDGTLPGTEDAGAPYFGPIPMVTHVHGAHVNPISDGYPEAWTLPNAIDIPLGYTTTGTFYDTTDPLTAPGTAVYEYSNDQPTTTLWYHDHSLGITRLNVYAASAGFWLIRTPTDGESGLITGTLPGPAPGVLNDPLAPAAGAIREIPLAIQPKSFNFDGSQFYSANRAFFEGLGDGQIYGANNPTIPNPPGTPVAIPFMPDPASDIAAVWNPEMFFNTMVVNGVTWPVLNVAQAQYRFRVLNASDSRFLNLSLFTLKQQGNGKTMKPASEIPIFQIGSEQGLLPQVVQLETGYATPLVPGQLPPKNNSQKVKGTFKEQALLVGPAERADIVVDFSALPAGTIVRMFNTAPDAPFGGFPDVPADPTTTGQVMQFVVDPALNGLSPTDPTGLTPATSPYNLALDANPGGAPKLGPSTVTRDLALLEEESALLCVFVDAKTGAITLDPLSTPPLCAGGSVPFAPKEAVLGFGGSAGALGATATLWDDPIVTNPQLGAVETWELWNHSADAHPIHLHLVKFEVVNRQVIGGAVRPPEPWEMGWKDTVIAYPGEITRVKANFDIAGLYVWHCHILSHEDNEMMVPYCVGDSTNCTLPVL